MFKYLGHFESLLASNEPSGVDPAESDHQLHGFELSREKCSASFAGPFVCSFIHSFIQQTLCQFSLDASFFSRFFNINSYDAQGGVMGWCKQLGCPCPRFEP